MASLIEKNVNNSDDRNISLTLKKYQVGGLSQAIFEKEQSIHLRVSGPLGKNLGVEPAGLNVAFAAGTGVLPFMDLVGFIGRHTAGIT